MAAVVPKPPGQVLEEKIKEKNLTQQQAADRIGITRQYLNGIINGKYPFTADLSLKLKDPLGLEPDFWTEAVRSYDDFLQTDAGREAQREKDRESLLLDFELQGVRTLVDHQIEASVHGRYLEIEPFNRERLQGTYYLASCGLKGFHFGTDGSRTPVATKPSVILRRGETLAISTLERITIPSRLRGQVLGLSDALAEKCLQLSCNPILGAGFRNSLSLLLTNIGPFEVRLSHGDPCVAVTFEYLAQEPVRSS